MDKLFKDGTITKRLNGKVTGIKHPNGTSFAGEFLIMELTRKALLLL